MPKKYLLNLKNPVLSGPNAEEKFQVYILNPFLKSGEEERKYENGAIHIHSGSKFPDFLVLDVYPITLSRRQTNEVIYLILKNKDGEPLRLYGKSVHDDTSPLVPIDTLSIDIKKIVNKTATEREIATLTAFLKDMRNDMLANERLLVVDGKRTLVHLSMTIACRVDSQDKPCYECHQPSSDIQQGAEATTVRVPYLLRFDENGTLSIKPKKRVAKQHPSAEPVRIAALECMTKLKYLNPKSPSPITSSRASNSPMTPAASPLSPHEHATHSQTTSSTSTPSSPRFYSMRDVEGKDMDKVIPVLHKTNNKEAALKLCRNFLKILSDLHAQRITHRDLKPSNIKVQLDEYTCKFLDFGAASLFEKEKEEGIFGTPMYMPLHLDPKNTTKEDDIFSASVVMAEILNAVMANKTPRLQNFEWENKKMLATFYSYLDDFLVRNLLRIKDFLQDDVLADDVIKLLRTMHHNDRERRPTALEALTQFDAILKQHRPEILEDILANEPSEAPSP